MGTVVGVLRVAKIGSGGADYYLEVAEGTGTGVEAAGRWMGEGPSELGLRGAVAAADFGAVLAGADPGTGEVLGTARHRVRVAGFDMTFAAPKSVSLLHALGDDDVSAAVAAGHDRAVAAAMSYVERHALAVRRRTGVAPGPVPTTVTGVAAAGFVHRLSRALDPHLHTHVVVPNLGRGPEGDWSALDGRGVYAHLSATDALYHSHLRHELTGSLGVAWGRPDRGRADIAGIAPEARREFSRRATQIARYLAGGTGAGGDGATGNRSGGNGVAGAVTGGWDRAAAALATRARKDPTVGADELRPQWEERARTVGLGPRRLEAVLDRSPRRSGPSSPSVLDGVAFATAVTGALGRLERPVARRDVIRASCRDLPEGAPAPAVEDAADRLLTTLEPDAGQRGRRAGPGVAERRHQVASPDLELAPLLARRGIGLDRSASRGPDIGPGLG
jgi:conjugative relaxase-like TrwC/TraI family protein